ncbi:tetratricopeptide repeat protein [Jannaschia marina]|uniref:tetratricopeptide repeat protein n=1 Tax=Jannaschia marina TaxID=2741674 RepID=UPI0015CE7365|nr:tetratricopeptide repeat protein [Jannaschia marina]
MSNTDSFIDEVSEEVRRDRLYALLRRWGWLPALAIVVIVGGAGWSEWTKAREAEKARAFGDSLLTALGREDMEARRGALAELEATDPQEAALLSLLLATAALNGEGGDPAAAREELLGLADATDVDATYRHLALLKAMLAGGTGDAARDGLLLEELSAPGAPFRTLAVEQQALRALAAGDKGTAVTLLRALLDDAETTQDLRRRARQLIVALGAEVEPA